MPLAHGDVVFDPEIIMTLWAPCRARIIEEAAQGATALYHAVSLRNTYGRAAVHGLEMADHAEARQSHGAMPVVVKCRDELQLPSAPASAGIFAEKDDVDRALGGRADLQAE